MVKKKIIIYNLKIKLNKKINCNSNWISPMAGNGVFVIDMYNCGDNSLCLPTLKCRKQLTENVKLAALAVTTLTICVSLPLLSFLFYPSIGRCRLQ